MILTTYFKNLMLNAILGNSSISLSNCYLCLFTADPGASGSFANEVAGGSYARVPLKTLMGTPSGGQTSNTSAITTPTATASWGTILYYGLADSSGVGTGNLLMYRALGSAAKTINTGGFLTMAIGAFTLRGSDS